MLRNLLSHPHSLSSVFLSGPLPAITRRSSVKPAEGHFYYWNSNNASPTVPRSLSSCLSARICYQASSSSYHHFIFLSQTNLRNEHMRTLEQHKH